MMIIIIIIIIPATFRPCSTCQQMLQVSYVVGIPALYSAAAGYKLRWQTSLGQQILTKLDKISRKYVQW
jgi:hypothetical protein